MNSNKKIMVSLVIGTCAGIIDIVPGIIQGVDLHITFAGFTFWVIMGFVVAHISLPISDWIKGLIIAFLLSIPGTILMSASNPKIIIPMFILSIVLGSFVGYFTGKYAN